MEVSSEILENRKKLAERFGQGVQTGGKGSVRRKRKTARKGNNEDKKIVNSLKKLGLNALPGIDEVNMFMGDGTVLHIAKPKVQGSIQSSCFVISGGESQTKKLTDFLPELLSKVSDKDLSKLKPEATDEVPELEENFDEATKH